VGEGAVLIIEAEGVWFYRDKKINDPGFKRFHLVRCKKAPVPPSLRNFDLGPGLGTDKNKLEPVTRYNLRLRKVKK